MEMCSSLFFVFVIDKTACTRTDTSRCCHCSHMSEHFSSKYSCESNLRAQKRGDGFDILSLVTFSFVGKMYCDMCLKTSLSNWTADEKSSRLMWV